MFCFVFERVEIMVQSPLEYKPLLIQFYFYVLMQPIKYCKRFVNIEWCRCFSFIFSV